MLIIIALIVGVWSIWNYYDDQYDYQQKIIDRCILINGVWVCPNYENRYIIDNKYELINVTK